MELQTILYGGDYNPEQWLKYPEILEKDIEYLKEAKINTVTIGMFSWAALEPEEGNYQLEWLEDRINRLYENGISVILATPSGARPKWLADRYQEVLRVREDGVLYKFGGRHNHCYTSPIYRKKVREINRQLAKRFGNHKAVILWHISNEYGGECHCKQCQKAFQIWLKDKYKTIDKLNECWNTTFWSHTYQDFSQVESPSSIGENAIHGLNLDWKRFVTAQTTDFMKWEIDSLKLEGICQPVTTNFMYRYTGLDYKVLSKEIDVVSWDSYPVWHKQKEDIFVAYDTAFQHDFMRSLKKKNFLLMESSPSSTNWQGVSKLRRPNVLKTSSLQAVAHGSNSILYFQIRQSIGSSEKFHGAVIDHYGGNDTRIYKEVKELGGYLQQLEELLHTEVKTNIAILYDIENQWSMEDAQGPRNKGLFYTETIMKSYEAIRKQGYMVDIISQEDELEPYSLIIVPMLYLFQHNIQVKIEKFVKNGGTVVMTYHSGIVDCYDRCFLGGNPYQLMDVFGVRRTEIDGLYDGEVNYLLDEKREKRYECRHLCEILQTTTAKALYTYEREFYQNTPAVTKNRYGKGDGYYIGADVCQSFYDDLYKEIIHEIGLEPIIQGTIPFGIEVSKRENSEVEYLFIQNYRNEMVLLDNLEIEGEWILGEKSCEIGAYDTYIIKRKRKDRCT